MTAALAAALLAQGLALDGCAKEEGAKDGSAGDGGAPDGGVKSSRAYKGHASDADSNKLVNAWPKLVGTRLDDCMTCHTGGTVKVDGKDTYHNQCNFCHDYAVANPKPDGAPAGYEATLNPFGLDYKNAGRSIEALKSIEGKDSDGDSYSNIDEVNAIAYPGNAKSFPGQKVAPTFMMNADKIAKIASYKEFLLLNASRQSEDQYSEYEGVKLSDVLAAAGVDLNGANGVTVFAADGYATAYTIDQVKNLFPKPLWYADLQKGGTTLGDKGFVLYPDKSVWPTPMTHMGEIPGDHYLMIALKRDGGQALDKSYLDSKTGKINGEGPYRTILPQAKAGRPDRGSKDTAVGDGYDYDANLDHNAGSCAKAVVAIRIDPMPAGYEEFDFVNGGWAYIDAGEMVIYGQGVPSK
jgi:hypothetical protein